MIIFYGYGLQNLILILLINDYMEFLSVCLLIYFTMRRRNNDVRVQVLVINTTFTLDYSTSDIIIISFSVRLITNLDTAPHHHLSAPLPIIFLSNWLGYYNFLIPLFLHTLQVVPRN